MSKIIFSGKFSSPQNRARDRLSEDFAKMLLPALQELGWEVVTNDMLSIVGGIIATNSAKPANDLGIAAGFLRRYNWARAKKLLFASQQGIDPSQVAEDFLKAKDQETEKNGGGDVG